MKEIVREYNMSNAALCMMASNFVVFMNRDASEFAVRGVDSTDITDFETLGGEFEAYPSDEEYLGLVMLKVDEKNAVRSEILNKIRSISGYFEQQWGLSSGQYKRLAIKNIDKISDNLFLMKSRGVVRMANEYLSELTAIGLTQSMIDSLSADAQLFEDKMNSVKDAKALRDEKTEERALKGNNLYKYVKKYSMIGKLIWENVSESKYNDYIIYHTTPQMPGKVQNMKYDYELHLICWSAAINANEYQLERKYYSDQEWTKVYQGTELSFNDTPPGSGTWYYRCRGINEEGSGAWSDDLEVIIPN